MQRCLNCRKEFKYTQVLHSIIGQFKWQIVSCNYCGRDHKITLFSKFLISTLIIAFPIVMVQYIFPDPPLFAVALLWFAAWVIMLLAISPYFIKFKE